LDDAIRQWKLEGRGIHMTQDKVCTLLQVLLVEYENELQSLLRDLNVIIQN